MNIYHQIICKPLKSKENKNKNMKNDNFTLRLFFCHKIDITFKVFSSCCSCYRTMIVHGCGQSYYFWCIQFHWWFYFAIEQCIVFDFYWMYIAKRTVYYQLVQNENHYAAADNGQSFQEPFELESYSLRDENMNLLLMMN